jgi:hypothetical protein
LLIDAADLKDANFVSITLPALANPPKYTQAQLDSLNQELKPTLDFRFSEKGIIQRREVQINIKTRLLKLIFCRQPKALELSTTSNH